MLAAPVSACNASGDDSELGLSPAGMEQKVVTVTTSDGKTHDFTVEVARTPEEQQRGLMFRQELAKDRGMIFFYEPADPASFWMKNTYVSLDLIFIRPDGTIARISENAIPLSIEPHLSIEPVSAVLEINGGLSAEYGIKEGDKVVWPR